MEDHVFKEHANWAAFTLNSFHWPKSWQRLIYKVERNDHDQLLLVWPRNPEYRKFLDLEFWERNAVVPPPYLPVIEFRDMDSLQAWVDVCERMR